MDKLTINSGSGYKLSINNVEQDKIELGVDSILPPVVCGDVTTEQLDEAIGVVYGEIYSLSGRISNEESTRASADENLKGRLDAIYNTGGGSGQIIPSVSMGSYENGTLTYTGGQLRPGLNAAGVIIDGLARLEFAGNTPAAYVTCSNAGTGFDELFQSNSATRPCLSALIGFAGAGTVAIGWSTVGDSVNDTITVGSDPFTVEFLADRVVLTVGGVEHVSPICPVPLTTPYTKFFTQSSAEVSFFTPGGGPSGLLPDETAARIAGDAALQDQIDDVQTLAQVNQLNITTKADQLDLDALQTTVTGQGLTLAQKADTTALDALSTIVSGKATPADITAAIAALVDGAPDALNTLAELATALAGEQAQISAIYDADNGGTSQIIPTVNNGTYENGVLTYAGGELRPGLPAAGVIINGLARLEFAGNTQDTYVTCSNAGTGFDELFESTSATRPRLLAAIDAAGTVAIGWSTVSDSGSTVVTVGNNPFTVEFLADRIVLTVGGVEHVSPVCPVPLTTPYTKLLALTSAEVSFFTPGGGASGLLPDETAARIAGDDALADAIANIELTPGPQGIQGPAGATGATGPAGPGVATGGTAGQVLSKIDGTDYNTQWVTPSSGGTGRPKFGSKYYPAGRWYDASYTQHQHASVAFPQTMTLGYQYFVPFFVFETVTVDQLGIYSNAVSGGTVQVGIYASDANNNPGAAIVRTSAMSTTSSGAKTEAVSVTLQPNTVYWLAFVALGKNGSVMGFTQGLSFITGASGVTSATGQTNFGVAYINDSTNSGFLPGGAALPASAPAISGYMAIHAGIVPRVMFQTA